MQLTAVIMVKNEVDVIRDCCGHLLALFEDVVIIDHRSTDGTREYIAGLEKRNSKLHVYYLTEPGYYQSQLMTWVVKNVPACVGADWLFLLDADEVLPFASAARLKQALENYSSFPIIRMSWKNLVPEEYSSEAIMGRWYLETEASTVYHKIAYQPLLLDGSNYTIAQGNHAILHGDYGGELPSEPAFDIFHIPVRSADQFLFKIKQGTAAYTIMGKGRNKTLGSHWFDISRYIEKNGISNEFLNGVAYRYGQAIDVNDVNITKEELVALGCSRIRLSYACDGLPEFMEDTYVSDKTTRMLSDLEEASNSATTEGEVHFKLGSNKEIRCMGNKREQYYNMLPAKSKASVIDDDLEFVIDFISPAGEKIESITATAWGGHIPFLFCLFACLKPRVYAELGSHYGASFFAACQAMQRNKLDGQAVAVDLWEGDEHAGFYSESVFSSFQATLSSKYSDVGDYLRMSFDDARGLFENESIDLLHIDGLHTYEAVKHDYETWRSKVAKNGVILFHDTNVFERGFGVWRLWKEVSGETASFEFKHTHGLGVLAFGSRDENPVVRLLEIINGSAQLSGFFESYFSRLGELVFNEAVQHAEEKSVDSSLAGRMPTKIQQYKAKTRGHVVSFVKSVPILRRMAYSVLKVVRR